LSLSTIRTFISNRFNRPIRWRRLALEILLFGALFVAIDQWMSRHLLSTEQPAPISALPTLTGGTATLPAREGPVLVYFFAPWCTVCHLSIGNLESIAEQRPELSIQLVALDYSSVEEVRAFIDDKQLPFPVLLGNTSTFSDWQVKGYPTYYLVNEAGNIQARNAGYSTQIGLWLRSAL